MKVTTDACLFGGWAVERVEREESGEGSRESLVDSGEDGVGRREEEVVSRKSLVDSRDAGVSRILEIGTGTGLLALMMAQKTNAFIDTIEIDKEAYEQAKENISASPWKERINIYQGDARTCPFTFKYDMIISNPPFYENDLKSPDEKKNIALHGGLTLQELLSIIKKNLADSGRFFLLLPYKRKEEIEKLIKSKGLYILRMTLVRQSLTHDYFRIMIEGSYSQDNVNMTADEIPIWNDKQQYTDEFVDLLKEYYLYL